MPQRSPLIFWLLLAATLSVDAVAIVWFSNAQSNRSVLLFLALAICQLSILCVWSVRRRRLGVWRWLIPFGAGLGIASVAASTAFRDGAGAIGELLFTYAGLFWIHSIFAIAGAWLAMSIGHRVIDGVADAQLSRFSVKNLFVVMTVSAILLTMLVRNQLLSNDLASLATFVGGSVLLLIVALRAHAANWPSYIRVSGALAAAIAIGNGAIWTRTENSFWIPFFLIQAVVLVLWFESTDLTEPDLPPTAAVAEAGPAKAAAE